MRCWYPAMAEASTITVGKSVSILMAAMGIWGNACLKAAFDVPIGPAAAAIAREKKESSMNTITSFPVAWNYNSRRKVASRLKEELDGQK